MMGQTPENQADYKISVIVPVYNARQYLAQSVESILGQTYRNLELLLVDDESTDGSGGLCDRYAAQDDRVRVIHRKNGGCTAASLTGLQEASGDYCMFVDSDDYIDADTLLQMSGQLVGQKGEIVCCNHILEKSRGTIPAVCPAAPGVYEGEALRRRIKARLLGNEQRILPFSRCMKLYERSVFEGNAEYCDTAIHMGEDFNLVYPALLDCTRLVVMEGALFYHYRFVENSMVHGYSSNMLDSVERVRALWIRVSAGKGITDAAEAIDREYCLMLLLVMKNELRNPDSDYLQRARDIFTRPDIRKKIVDTPLSLKNKANLLLYFGMRHPHKAVLRILRMIVKRYDGVGRKDKAR